MIRNIVFGGCSYTWGQSLHLFNKSDVKSDTPALQLLYMKDSDIGNIKVM